MINKKKWKSVLSKSDNCTGCMVCMNQCTREAIRIKKDSFGCYYPFIDEKKCIQCKQCESVCSVLSDLGWEPFKEPEVYAAISKYEKNRLYSTSGGIFPALAENIVKSGGYVVGAVYDHKLQVRHILTNNNYGLLKMRQSKYVQSYSGYIYQKVEKKLKEGKSVLFSGTPCQIEALNLYLGKKKYAGSLITCEVICIGVPCPGFYYAYLKNLEKKYHSRVKKIWFKNKELGWDQLLTKIEFENGVVYKRGKESDYYIKAYRRFGFILRKCCYNCRFKKMERHADITLGDFWNLRSIQFRDNKGTSLVILNSVKGKELFQQIESEIYKERRLLKEAMRNEGLLYNTPYTYKTRLCRWLFHRVPFDTIIRIADLLY